MAHRVAFKLETGMEPPEELDHRDGDGRNNRLENLRVPEGADNKLNKAINSRNTSGVIGVSASKTGSPWRATIQIGGKQVHRRFKTKEEATAWRLAKEIELHGEFAQHLRA